MIGSTACLRVARCATLRAPLGRSGHRARVHREPCMACRGGQGLAAPPRNADAAAADGAALGRLGALAGGRCARLRPKGLPCGRVRSAASRWLRRLAVGDGGAPQAVAGRNPARPCALLGCPGCTGYGRVMPCPRLTTRSRSRVWGGGCQPALSAARRRRLLGLLPQACVVARRHALVLWRVCPLCCRMGFWGTAM